MYIPNTHVKIYDKKALNKIVEAVKPIIWIKQLFYKETSKSKPQRITTDIETINAISILSAKAVYKHLLNETEKLF